MKKFALFVFTIFFASTTAALAIKNASFSVKCEGQATHCEILGDQSSITTIENCNTPRSWKPPAGHAYLIPRNLLSQCGEKTQINCDRKLVYINDDIITNSYHLLMSCANETSYNTTFYGGTESQWAHELKGSSALSIPYKKKLCLSTGGTFNASSQTCNCPRYRSNEFTDSGCMCDTADLKYIGLSEGCADISMVCTASGGHGDFGTPCACPSNLNLVQTETKTGCMCKPGFIWQNPLNKQAGCVEKGKTFPINITIKSSNGQTLSGAKISYYDEDGQLHETTSNANGVFTISALQNTSYVRITADNHVSALYSAVALSTKTELELEYLSQDKAGVFYQACLLQPEDPSRAASGLRAKPDTPTDDNWLYCGGFTNERDCGNDSHVVSIDNKVYKCTVDPTTKVGTWTLINIQELKSGRTCMWSGASAIFCERYGSFEHILHESEGIIIAMRRTMNTTLSDGKTYNSYIRDTVCYQNVSDCAEPNKFSCDENVCPKLNTGPKWGIPDSGTTTTPTTADETLANTDGNEETTNTTCETSGGTLDEDGATCKCDTTNGLKANDDNTLCECVNTNMTFDSTTKKCTASTSNISNTTSNTTSNITNNVTNNNVADKKEKLKKAEEAYKKAKENEQSLANRTLGAASTAATGLGLMNAAAAYSEQKADEAAEKDMSAYLETFRCEYGKGQTTKAGVEDITLPGGNDLLTYYTEYKQIADALKTTKKALGMRPGIEEEVVYDRAETGLYQYSSVGKTGGAYTSLARALTDPEGEDAAAWNAQKDATKKKLKAGAIAAGAGIVGGIVGDMLINGNKKGDGETDDTTDETIYDDVNNAYQALQSNNAQNRIIGGACNSDDLAPNATSGTYVAGGDLDCISANAQGTNVFTKCSCQSDESDDANIAPTPTETEWTGAIAGGSCDSSGGLWTVDDAGDTECKSGDDIVKCKCVAPASDPISTDDATDNTTDDANQNETANLPLVGADCLSEHLPSHATKGHYITFGLNTLDCADRNGNAVKCACAAQECARGYMLARNDQGNSQGRCTTIPPQQPISTGECKLSHGETLRIGCVCDSSKGLSPKLEDSDGSRYCDCGTNQKWDTTQNKCVANSTTGTSSSSGNRGSSLGSIGSVGSNSGYMGSHMHI